MTARIYVILDPKERNALGKLAAREYREVRAQAAMLIRLGLEKEGLLEPSEPVGTNTNGIDGCR